jgi:hypothetical protein
MAYHHRQAQQYSMRRKLVGIWGRIRKNFRAKTVSRESKSKSDGVQKQRIPHQYKGFCIVPVDENSPYLGHGGGGLKGWGFRAMNWYAARDNGIPFPFSKETFVIWRDDPDVMRTLDHEVDEVYCYEHGLKGYEQKTHPIATVLEPIRDAQRRKELENLG